MWLALILFRTYNTQCGLCSGNFIKVPKQPGGGFIYEVDQLPVLATLAWWRCETHLYVDPSRPRLHTCLRGDLGESFRVTGTVKVSEWDFKEDLQCGFLFFLFLTLDESSESRDTHRAASREAVYRYVSFISWYSGKSMPVKSISSGWRGEGEVEDGHFNKWNIFTVVI